MKPFVIKQVDTVLDATEQFKHLEHAQNEQAITVYYAGGTNIVDLMKLNILQPDTLIDLTALKSLANEIVEVDCELQISAFTTMADLAENSIIKQKFQVVAESINLAASAQIRNTATIGGNLLQRTRCTYFRNDHHQCNKLKLGSGCAARSGDSRALAILGTSESCIANYPGDLAVALVTLDASINLQSPDGTHRTIKVEDLHRLPKHTPNQESNLESGELITSIYIPNNTWQASNYTKVRDRNSYAFALSSVATALSLDEELKVKDIRITLGGLATKPWRCFEAETFLQGKTLNESTVIEAANLCFQNLDVDKDRAFKVELGKRTVVKGLIEVLSQVVISSKTI